WRERVTGALRRALPDPGRAGCLGTSVVAVLGCLVFAFGWGSGSEPARVPVREPTTVDPVSTTTAATERIVVSVVGRVHRPGLITLDGGARVAQALRAAGGPLPETDTLGLNLARQLSDGEQLYVGVEPPEEASTGGSAEGTENSPVDLNEAGERELRELPGVGPVTADSILRWRAEHGPFASVEQLREVDGIGPATLARLRELVRV
ncbi:ComEA family DNA-binding protein, partial [Actinopolyspora mortivallis]